MNQSFFRIQGGELPPTPVQVDDRALLSHLTKLPLLMESDADGTLSVSVLLGVKVLVEAAVDVVASFSTPSTQSMWWHDLMPVVAAQSSFWPRHSDGASHVSMLIVPPYARYTATNVGTSITTHCADNGLCLSRLASRHHPLHRRDPSHAKSRRNSMRFDNGMQHSSGRQFVMNRFLN